MMDDFFCPYHNFIKFCIGINIKLIIITSASTTGNTVILICDVEK